jgi:hypothetical protein
MVAGTINFKINYIESNWVLTPLILKFILDFKGNEFVTFKTQASSIEFIKV